MYALACGHNVTAEKGGAGVLTLLAKPVPSQPGVGAALGCRRRDSARASLSWSTNTWRGGCPNCSPVRHKLAAARPKEADAPSDKLRPRLLTGSFQMQQDLTLFPISGLAAEWDDEPFDESKLPAAIVPDVTIENVSSMFTDNTWDSFKTLLSHRDMQTLKQVEHAIVHRFNSAQSYVDGIVIDPEQRSRQLVERLAACLRLVRPMRQFAMRISGSIRTDGTIDVRGFEEPAHLLEVPSIQKGFLLRNRDITELETVANDFLRAMDGEYWKFRMPVSLFDGGHFLDRQWKSRFSLWASAIEGIYTSQSPDREHSGSRLAKARIKWFLGPKTPIYAPGDVQSYTPQHEPTVEDMLDDLYEVRNCIAHGDKVPDRFFTSTTSTNFGPINTIGTLEEAASFIIRQSLLKILKDNLLEHFRGGPESQAYFKQNGLINSLL
jgi:hypothetical protein